MLEKKKFELRCIEEVIHLAEENDMSWDRHYTELCHRRDALKAEIKKLERQEKKNRRYNEDDD